MPLDQVKAIEIHHLVPRGDKIFDKFVFRVVAAIDLGIRTQLCVRAKDKVSARAGPLEVASAAIAAFENLFGVVDSVPSGVEIEQIRKEIVRQLARTRRQNAVL